MMRSGISSVLILLIFLIIPLTPGYGSESLSKGASDDPLGIEANSISYDYPTDTYYADGHVIITYSTGTLTADRVALDKQHDQARAEGHVILQSGQDILEGDRIDFDIRRKTGIVYQGRAFMARNHFYLAGDRIEKTGESSYHADGAKVTSCDGPFPDWQLVGDKLDVTIEGYGTLKNTKLLAKGLPVFYVPYLIFPAKTKRQSGLLAPYFAYSDSKLGLDVEIPFFWAVSDDMDATFYQRYMDKRGYKQGFEFRYFTSPENFGNFYGDFMIDTGRVMETAGGISRDWKSDHQRWSIYLDHQTEFSPGFYFRADIRKVSDSWYFKDFSSHNYYLNNYASTGDQRFRNVPFVGNETLGSLESTARLVKNWSLYNLTLMGSYTDDFSVSSNEATLQKYPEATLTGIKRPLWGTPVQFEFTTAYAYNYRDTGQRGHFYELKPTLSMPLNMGGYGQITPEFGVWGVMWHRDDHEQIPSDKQGERNLYRAALNLNTEISRVFNVGGTALEKIRHSIRPEISYVYIPYLNQSNLPDFIESIGEQHTLSYGLINSVLIRWKEKDGKISYRELLRVKLAQTYDFIESNRNITITGAQRRPFGDILIEADFVPFQYLSFSARDKYSIHDATWSQANYDLILSDARGDIANLGYRYTKDSIEEINLNLKAVVDKSIDLTYSHRRNQLIHKDFEKKLGLNYHKQCWNVELSYTEKLNTTVNQYGISTEGDKVDRTYMLTLSLYGLGTIGK